MLLLAEELPTALREVLLVELEDLTALLFDCGCDDLTADEDDLLDLDELLPDLTADELPLLLPDLTELDFERLLEDLLLTPFGADERLELLLTADLEDEDLALVAFELFWLLELFTAFELLLLEDDLLATWELLLLLLFASRDDLELCG